MSLGSESLTFWDINHDIEPFIKMAIRIELLIYLKSKNDHNRLQKINH